MVSNCTVACGQGQHGTGAKLSVCSAGDLVNNTAGLYFAGQGQDLGLFELSWLGFNHFQRPNTSTAWTRTMGIASNGGWTFYVSHGNASDQSLKSYAKAASTEDCLSMLRQVSARKYQRINLPGTGSRLGFVAQEVESACPSAWSNLVGTAQYAKKPGEAETSIKTLDYSRLAAVLWQCTRSLLARVEALEAKLAQ